ncbi:MAG: ferrous iron transport protein B [Solobacterium sp.]|nr:ferrous iron transport protein B [Solobacterium sp.]
MKLAELEIGQYGKIIAVGGEGSLRQHFLDMGVIPGVEVEVIKFAPLGDPMEIRIHNYELTLRLSEAEKIDIEQIDGLSKQSIIKKDKKIVSHPGLGEEGIFHPKGSGVALSDEIKLTFALVGNQNSGKTTLFNQLTGSNQHVGNFPGVTVDRKDGVIKGYPNTLVTDLPGIYSMSPYSSEEIVSRNFVLEEKPHAIINIMDVNSLDRSLYLSMQLLEMDIPMVIALNMMDELIGNGGSVDINAMEEALGVPVIPISAAKNEGVDELISHAIHIAKYQEKPIHRDYCSKEDHGGSLHRGLHAVIHLIEDKANKANLPLRFCASKIIEGDELILDALKLDENEKETFEHIVYQMEKERGLDRSAAMAEMRYAFIDQVSTSCMKRPKESKERLRSEKIDEILTGKFTAIPLFIAIMAFVFYLTFSLIGPLLQDYLALGIEKLGEVVSNLMVRANVNEAIQSLIMQGIFEGVGSVLSFLPIIVTMFFFLSILEDSGYIARVAFVMDKILRKIGLSGRSIVPMLIGFGCTVPAVMATRTLPSSRDRRMTILLTPFMSCTAKLPIYGFFIQAFFPEYSWLLITGLYLLGIVVAILMAILFKKTLFQGEAVPFVMELPNYRFPSAKNVMQLLWDKAKDFLERAFTVIFVATIVVWFLQSFDFSFHLVSDAHQSILASIAGILSPLMAPTGLGDWRIVTSLVSGFLAKESVISMMEMLFEGGIESLSKITVASLLVFSLLYTPCVAAIAAIKRELGGKQAMLIVIMQCAIAYVAALFVQLIGHLF